MLLLVGELVLWAAVGLVWFVVINALAVVVVFAAALAWRRRGKGGLLDRLLGPRGRSKSQRSPASPKGGKPAGASRNPLARLFNQKGAPRPRGDASGKKPGLLDRLLGGRPGASRKPGRPGDPSPKSPGGKSGASKPGGDASRTTSHSHGGRKPDGKKKPGLLDRLMGDMRDGFQERRAEGLKKEKAPKGKRDGQPAGVLPADEPAPKRAKEEKRREDTTMVRHEEDASLQRWGRNLKTVGPAIDELATTARQHVDVIDAIHQGVKRLTDQGDNDLPASKALTAEAEAIAADLRTIRDEEEDRANRLRAIAARAEALGIQYGRDHETDEARLAGERGGRGREKRADVGTAEQDT